MAISHNSCNKVLPIKKRKFNDYTNIKNKSDICISCSSDVILTTESLLIFKRSGRSLCQLCIEDECLEILTECEEVFVQRRYIQKIKTNEFFKMLEKIYS